METEAFKLDVHVITRSEPSLSASSSNLIINQETHFEEFIIDQNNHNVTSLGSYPDSSSLPKPQIYLNIPNYKRDEVYQLVHTQLHDHVLSELISDQIAINAQRLTSQSSDFQEQPLFMEVFVTLTLKRYIVVPSNPVPSRTESEDGTETTCAICLEDMSGGSGDKLQTPNCSHWFHESCLVEWLHRRNNSCPLCRQPIEVGV